MTPAKTVEAAARSPAGDALITARRLVIKVGSALLVGDDGRPRTAWASSLASDIASLRHEGADVILVTSGAIALGARTLMLRWHGRGPATLADAQAAAAVGQIALAALWQRALAGEGLMAGQMLLTPGDLADRRRSLNAAATLDRLLSLGAVPVINENDSVATAEIRFGDNDRLAARVGLLAGADAVVLLSDVDGLFDADPAVCTQARRIPRVDVIDEAIVSMAGAASAHGVGTGGMAAKVAAARIAVRAGVALIIADGTVDAPVRRLGTSEDAGTLFAPGPRTHARKSWLAAMGPVAGRIGIDPGAARALADGASLLPAGCTTVTGAFDRGDVVEIVDPEGSVLARGLCEYAATDAMRIVGLKSDAVAAALGHAPRRAMVHRDQMVML